MGAVSFSLDYDLVSAICKDLPLNVLVETGTFKGDTVAKFHSNFEKIFSIELSNELYEMAFKRFETISNVKILNGHSPDELKKLRGEILNTGVLYWLDAHWCVATEAAGERSQCPLLDELKAIGELPDNSVILIDDARLFTAPVPEPHESSQWPSFHQILTCLLSMSSSHELMIINDVIAFFPIKAKAGLEHYAQTKGIDWYGAALALKQNQILVNPHDELETALKGLHRFKGETDHYSASSHSQDVEIIRCHKQIESQAECIRRLNEQIQMQSNALSAYRLAYGRFSPLKIISRLSVRMGQLLRPRLGNLNQYPPRPLTKITPRKISNNKELPTISIVTPSYNQGDFIEKTILSVIDQGYPKLEYFIQDGASQDSTLDVLRKYQARISGWASEDDTGQSQAINRGFKKTTGEIMAWLNSDDLLLPGSLATVADYFARHPEIDAVYGNRLLVDKNGMEIGRWIMPGHDSAVLSWVDYIPQETLFWRRSLWEKAGSQMDESFRFALDWDLLVRFRDAGARFAHIPRFLGAFRLHPDQKTSLSLHGVGQYEMDLIRNRVLGREASHMEIRTAVLPFMLKHILVDLGYRIKSRLLIDKRI